MTLPIIIVAEYDARVPQNQGIIGTLLKAGCKRSEIFTPKRRVKYKTRYHRGWYRCWVIRLPDEDDPVEIVTKAYLCNRNVPCSFCHNGNFYTLLKKYGSKGETYQGFTGKVRIAVRSRDGEKCMVCKTAQDKIDKRLCVHHIDYDKTNSGLENLITLCTKCHLKTLGDKSYWEKKLKAVLKASYKYYEAS